MRTYSYDCGKLRDWIEKEKIKRFGVQLPAALLPYACEILEELSTFGEPLLIGEPAFGACDFPELESFANIDGILHLGHAAIPGIAKTRKILFLELYSTIEPMPLVELPEGIGERICLFSTVQYLKQLRKIAEFLEKAGKKAYIPKPKHRALHEGQVLGCDVSPVISSEPDSYLFVGDGDFHPFGVAFFTSKPVYRYQMDGRISVLSFDREKFLRAGIAKSCAIQDAKTVGICICTKPGQQRLKLARNLVEFLRKHGKKTGMVFINNLSPEILNWTGFDLLISTACPRIALEDYRNYKIPLLTPQEALLGLGEIKNYEIDQFLPEHI